MGRITKRLLCIMLCVALSICLTACEGKNKCDTPANEAAVSQQKLNETTVYVSTSGKKIHRTPNCSGMKHYDKMTYAEAVDAGYEFCKKCY